MQPRDFEKEFSCMDAYTVLSLGAAEAIKLLESGKPDEALILLRNRLKFSEDVLEHMLGLSFCNIF